jgi:hypothetical protein
VKAITCPFRLYIWCCFLCVVVVHASGCDPCFPEHFPRRAQRFHLYPRGNCKFSAHVYCDVALICGMVTSR